MERMTNTLKVYGWTGFAKGSEGRQSRLIVAAPSFAQARRDAEAAGLDKPRSDYCSESGNEIDVEVALASPGTVFGALNSFGPDAKTYFPVKNGTLCRSATEGPHDG